MERFTTLLEYLGIIETSWPALWIVALVQHLHPDYVRKGKKSIVNLLSKLLVESIQEEKSSDGRVYNFRISMDYYQGILACTEDSCPSTTLACRLFEGKIFVDKYFMLNNILVCSMWFGN